MLVLGSLRLSFLLFFLLLLLPHSVPLVVAFLLFPSFFPVPVCAVNTFFCLFLLHVCPYSSSEGIVFFSPSTTRPFAGAGTEGGLAWSPSSFLASQVLGRLKDEVVVEVALFFFCAEQAGCDAMRLSDTTVQLLWIC